MSALPTTTHSPTDFEGFYGWTDTLKGVQYGPGCLATALPKFLGILGVKKALIVTGRSLYEKVRCSTLTNAISIARRPAVDGRREAGGDGAARTWCVWGRVP